MPRRMWISSSVGARAVGQLVQPRHQLLGRSRVQVVQCHQGLAPVFQHARHLARIGWPRNRCGGFDTIGTQRHAPLIRHDLDRRAQVQRAERGVGRDAQRRMAAVDVLVGHAEAFGAEQEGHAGWPLRHVGRHQALQILPRRMRGRTEVAWRHGSGAQVVHAVQRLVQRLDDARVLQHVQRAAGPLDGLLPAQHVGPARGDQHQFVEAHDLHGARSGTHVAGVAGTDQDEAGAHAANGGDR